MRVIKSLEALPDSAKRPVIALGNFDGVHLGHQALIEETKRIAKEKDVPSAVVTFEPHPLEVLKPDLPPFRLTTEKQKLERLKETGVDICFCLPFTKSFSKITGQAFIEDLLVGALDIQHIVIGYDFIFGYQRSGNAELLKDYGQRYHYGFSQLNAVGDDTAPFSSSRIREHLRLGQIKQANTILGFPFAIEGKVIHGKQQGRLLGFPTANLALEKYTHPKFGVYAVEVIIGKEKWQGVANIGIKPTFDGTTPLLEVHVFDFSGDLYHKEISVVLCDFIREEQKFGTVDALRQQIAKDCKQAKEALSCGTTSS